MIITVVILMELLENITFLFAHYHSVGRYIDMTVTMKYWKSYG